MTAELPRPLLLRSTFGRALQDERRAGVGWAVGLAAFGAAMLGMYPTVRDNAALSAAIDTYPEALRTMFGLADYATGPGYLRAEVFSLVGPLLSAAFAIVWASDVVAGEEERGTIDLLLANPISRRRVLLEKWAAVVVGLTTVNVVLGVVLAVGGPLVGLHVGTAELVSTLIATVLLSVLFATVAVAVGAGTGRRGLSRGTTTVLVVAAYLVSSLADLVEWLRPWRVVSPWYHALGVDPLANGLQIGHVVVLLVLIAAVLGVGTVAFDRRDLGV